MTGRPRARVLVGILAAVVVGAAAGASVPRVRRWVSSQLALGAVLSVFVGVAPRLDLGGLFDWATGSISSIASAVWGAIKGAVRRFVEGAVDVGLSIVNLWINDVWSVIHSVYVAIGDAVSYAWGLVQQVYGWVSWLVDATASALWNGIAAVANTLAGWVSWFADQVARLTSEILATEWRILAWVVSNAWSIVKDSAAALFDLLMIPIRAGLDAVGSVVNGLICFAQMLYDGLSKAVDWIANVATAAVELVIKCTSFLVFVATHPFTWFFTVADDLVSRGAGWLIDRVAAGLSTDGDLIEQTLARWLSS